MEPGQIWGGHGRWSGVVRGGCGVEGLQAKGQSRFLLKLDNTGKKRCPQSGPAWEEGSKA